MKSWLTFGRLHLVGRFCLTLPMGFAIAATACSDQLAPSRGAEGLASRAGRLSSEVVNVDTILAALADPLRTDGTLIVGLKEADTVGEPLRGNQLPVQGRLRAEEAIRGAFPTLTVPSAVEYLTHLAEDGRPTSKKSYRGFIRLGGQITRGTLIAILRHPNVDFAEPNWRDLELRGSFAVATVVTASSDAQSWAIDSMRANDAWALGWRGDGVSVKLVDSGIDLYQAGHPDVASDSGNMIFNATWGRFADNACAVAYSACWYEGPYHGTGVYGVASARENNAAAVGIAPALPPWLAVGKATYVTTSGGQGGSVSEIADAVREVSSYHPAGRRVGITSVGISSEDTVYYRALRNEFKASYESGVLWFSAVHQQTAGVIGIPAIFPEVVAVGYLNQDLSLNANSPIHPKIEFVGPGTNITTSWNRASVAAGVIFGQSGSSFAAPAVAGAARIAWQANPTWTPATLRTQMQAYARDLGYPGRDELYGYGMPDVICLIQKQSPCDPLSVVGYISGPDEILNPTSPVWTAVVVSGGNGTYTYKWEYRAFGTVNWSQVGTGSSYTRSVKAGDPSFSLRLTITSGTRSTVNTLAVKNSIPTCGARSC